MPIVKVHNQTRKEGKSIQKGTQKLRALLEIRNVPEGLIQELASKTPNLSDVFHGNQRTNHANRSPKPDVVHGTQRKSQGKSKNVK